MPVTRAAVENELVNKLRGKLANRFWTLSVVTNGANPDLNGPMRRAVLFLGGTTADPITTSNADFAPFVGWSLEKLLDVARLEVLKVCLDQFAHVNVQTGQDRQDLGTLSTQIMAEIEYLESLVKTPYGPGMPVISTGVMEGPRGPGGPPGGDMPNDPFRPHHTWSRPGQWPYP